MYLAGSLSAGLGSSTSDADVYVLVADDAEMETRARQLLVGGQRIDVEYHRTGEARRCVEEATAWRTSLGDLSALGIAENDLDFAVRLTYAEVLRDSARLTRLRRRLDVGADGLRQLVISRWAMEANGHLEDFTGAFADGDLDSAALIGTSLMTAAGKAVAAAAGDIYLGRKWVFRQLRRSLPDHFPLAVFRMMMRGEWAKSPDAGHRDFTALLQRCLTAAQTLGWETAGGRRWNHWGLSPQPVRCHPAFLPVRLSDGVLLNHERSRQFVVEPHVALLWGLAAGRDENEYLSAAAALDGSLTAPLGLSVPDLRAVRRDLLQHGLLLSPTPMS
ncbi:hypothetical protein ABZ667_16950 [Streptomyces lavendulae]|uniref:hypothetical protein n=1 Tax=Streptomyces lavendulae TaxID=1914 RepID=UPI0033D41730